MQPGPEENEKMKSNDDDDDDEQHGNRKQTKHYIQGHETGS